MKKGEDFLVCAVCGGASIEWVGWIDPNTDKGTNTTYERDYELDNWCNTCEEHTEFCLFTEYQKLKEG